MARESDVERGRAAVGGDERRTPLASTLGLLVGFVVLAVVGVVTVVIPEITDDGDDEAGETTAAPEASAEPAAP